ncbi:PEP-CTERM sorting domain-containing protein [Laspinema sp. A4]|uniref:PEP-CTERM sorting domain-containing protein n=1 Tax=Laspinema sp. D2d TaxID=2953686 RepID=UPI0021BB9981|nr:PEP-CTERM sorting domain-containing protein [Laspinema sp. D2d]MCT7982918.1 PEP-CTERM sorting domain-containing protein [Laspinema sp. D2d]
MRGNLLTQSTLAITGAVFSLGAVAINPANAARITYDFSVPIYNRNDVFSRDMTPLPGRFSYDDATQITTVYEYEGEGTPQWGIWRYEYHVYEVDFIEFPFLDRVYTQADALSPISLRIEYADEREIGKFLSWETEDFSFIRRSYRSEDLWTEFDSKAPNIYSSRAIDFYRVQEEPTSVPEPSILAALSVVGLAGLLRKKRVKAQLVD